MRRPLSRRGRRTAAAHWPRSAASPLSGCWLPLRMRRLLTSRLGGAPPTSATGPPHRRRRRTSPPATCWCRAPTATAPRPALPVSGAPATSQAVAALSFDLPDGASVGALTLAIDGTAPPSAPTIVACKATQKFFAEENGAWTNVPPSDCSQTSSPKLSSDGKSLVFDDISKLVGDGRLSIVLLPGAVDRVVIKKPDDTALSVTTAGGLGAAAPPFGTGTTSGPTSSGFGSQPQAPVGGSCGAAACWQRWLRGGRSSGCRAVSSRRRRAGDPAGRRRHEQAAAPVGCRRRNDGSSPVSSSRWSCSVSCCSWATAMSSGSRWDRGAAGGAAGAVGGRLRPPDRGRQVAAAASSVGGVGRFRTERQGKAPRL